MNRQTMMAIIATAALSSGTTAALTQLANPAPADAGADSATLRQINSTLKGIDRKLGSSSLDGPIARILVKIRDGQSNFCRALADPGQAYRC